MAREERSAGVVIFHSASPTERKYLLLDYGRHWDFPKGHLESNETPLAAALRELTEETGITSVQLVPGFSVEIEYYFRDRRKGLIHKHVWFCLGETFATDVTLSDEHVGHLFLPFEEAMKRLTYATAREVLQRADDHLRQLIR